MNTISQNLNLRQSQDLVMTPQLQQAIKLLQLNNMELTEFVETALSENPLLERDESNADKDVQGVEIGQQDKEDADMPKPAEDRNAEITDSFDEAWTGNENAGATSDFSSDSMANVGAGGTMSFDENDQGFDSRITKEKSLRDHLQEQLSLSFDDARDHMIGTLLIDMLDESGYLRHDTDELAARLNCSTERIDKLLSEMKQFDPTGVFAADLAECMALQLQEKKALDAPMQALLDNLEMLGRYEHKKLAEICGVNDTYLKDMINEIKSLNPKPASEYDHFIVQTAVPDVIMRRLPKNLGGGWRVELNTETLPRVLVNNAYYNDVLSKTNQKKDKDYLNQQLNDANWLVKALDQRAKTIIKVASEIVEYQEMFFLYGIEYLRPLTLKDVAEKIEMHESTVSRVTTNKYIGTPRGLFELKYFFSSSLGGEGGAGHSSESVKARIKQMVDQEAPDDILSDDRIVEALKEGGIDIARRTVAKYRDALNIPSSVQRRRQKKNS